MDVNVITCYKVKLRRSPWQRQVGITPADRSTFRLCVAREDVDKLLNDEMWPAHISVTAWTFLKPGQQQQSTTNVNIQDRQPLDNRQHETSTTVCATSGHDDTENTEDMDATIIIQHVCND